MLFSDTVSTAKSVTRRNKIYKITEEVEQADFKIPLQ